MIQKNNDLNKLGNDTIVDSQDKLFYAKTRLIRTMSKEITSSEIAPSKINVDNLIGIIDNLIKENNNMQINDPIKINNLIESSITPNEPNETDKPHEPDKANEPIKPIEVIKPIEPDKNIQSGILIKRNSSELIVSISNQKKNVTFFPYEFLELAGDNLKLYNPNLILFDLQVSQKYSLGLDSYLNNYGTNYFAFFERLGQVNCFIIKHIDSKIIIGSVCIIFKNHISYHKKTKRKLHYWYICDLKIDNKHRKQGLTIKLFEHIYHRFSLISQRLYLIAMDPDSQQIIHIINKLQPTIHFKFKHKYKLTKLLIYTVPVIIMKEIERYFTCIFNKITYLALAGVKDMVLSSTGKSMNLYHLQHDNRGKKLMDVPEDVSIMFCFPKDSPLEDIMNSHDIRTDITATIISWSMNFFDWHDVLTSDF